MVMPQESSSPDDDSALTTLQERRDFLRKSLEDKHYDAAVAESFKILREGEKSLFTDALDAIMKIGAADQKRINKNDVPLLVDLLCTDDDILRASVVLALRPIAQARQDLVFNLLSKLLSASSPKHCVEASIRLIGQICTQSPERGLAIVPDLIGFLGDENQYVRKIASDVLKILARQIPSKLEKELAGVTETVQDADVLASLNEVIEEIAKAKEQKSLEDRLESEEMPAPVLIPEMPAMKPSAGVSLPSSRRTEPDLRGAQAEQKKLPDVVKLEIDEKIAQEFAKVEDGTVADRSELRKLKEIKTAKDLERPKSVKAKKPL